MTNTAPTASSAAPLVLNGSAALDQLKSSIRLLLGMATGLGLLSRFLTPAQLAWVQSSDGVAALSAVVAAGVTAWAWIERKMAKAQLRLAALAHPSAVVVRS